MAIDTEQRRRAAAALPLQPCSLLPDGTISQADRQQVGWGYPGISADPDAGESSAGTLDWQIESSRMQWSYETDPMEWTPRGGAMEWSVDK